jgi:quercetin dioxygenase-like cupin family protein
MPEIEGPDIACRMAKRLNHLAFLPAPFRNHQEANMEVMNWRNSEEITIEKFPYRGKSYDVKGIRVRWLSRFGKDDMGYPEYGLRLFTAEPEAEIPIHNHFYVQTMYILSGQFECWRFDPQTDEMVDKWTCGPGDVVYVPSMEPHGMRNTSHTEGATFLCCICNVYEDEGI